MEKSLQIQIKGKAPDGSEQLTIMEYIEVVREIEFTTNRMDSPGKLKFTCLEDGPIGIPEGSSVEYLVDGIQFNKTSWTEVPAKTILLSIPFIIAAMFICNVASEFIELPNLVEDTFIGMSRNVFGIIAIAVMAPLVEELLFRGAIEGHFLQTGKRPGMAILLSALIFGLIHVNPAQVPFAFCLGLVFGWLYYRTGSIIPGMIGHFLNNSLATIAMATSTQEELNEKTVDMIGATPTYILLAAAIIILVGMYFYLNKHLPQPGTPSEITNTQA